MAENTEPTNDAPETETEVEVEAHAESVLPLQGLSTPIPDGLMESGKSTFSVGC